MKSNKSIDLPNQIVAPWDKETTLTWGHFEKFLQIQPNLHHSILTYRLYYPMNMSHIEALDQQSCHHELVAQNLSQVRFQAQISVKLIL